MIIERNELREIVFLPVNIGLAVARGVGRLVLETYDGIVGRIDGPKEDL